jgi:polar amino acid transport system substrate-binding protein
LKKLVIVLFALALAGTGCQFIAPSESASSRGHLPEILARGELRVGISGDLPPLNMKNKAGEIIGLEVDLVTALANSMGLDVRLVETPFPELLEALESDEVDLVISGMTMTPERNARVAFVGPYFISGTSVLTKSEEIAGQHDAKELDVAGRKYAALEGSTSAQFVTDVLPQSTLVTTSDYESAIEMVIAGEADGMVGDFQACMVGAWQNPDAGLLAIRTPFTVEPLGIALPPDSRLFLNLVSNYLGTLEDTGILSQLKARWLSDGSWLSELP